MELEEVKNYLRVDYDEDDGLILLLMDTAKEYITSTVGWDFTEASARMKLVFLKLVATMYQNRNYTFETSSAGADEKLMLVVKSILTQLQLEGR